jgi:hypothetical protein
MMMKMMSMVLHNTKLEQRNDNDHILLRFLNKLYITNRVFVHGNKLHASVLNKGKSS